MSRSSHPLSPIRRAPAGTWPSLVQAQPRRFSCGARVARPGNLVFPVRSCGLLGQVPVDRRAGHLEGVRDLLHGVPTGVVHRSGRLVALHGTAA